MKKQRIQLITLLAVLVLLIGGYIGLRAYNTAKEKEEAEAEGEVIVSLEEDSITHFAYDYDEVNYAYEKIDDEWRYSADTSLTLTQYRLTTIESKLEEIVAKEVITGVTDLEQYGLTDGARTLTFGTADAEYSFLIGDQNDITSDYYLCSTDDLATVYTVESARVTVLNLNVEDIIEEEEEAEDETEGETDEVTDETTEAEGETDETVDETTETADQTAEAESVSEETGEADKTAE